MGRGRTEHITEIPGNHAVEQAVLGRSPTGGSEANLRLTTDKGTDFTIRVGDQWAHHHQVALHFIERGKPTRNAFIESFNGRFRDECVNQNWFVDRRDAREVIEVWRAD
jgi:transposase InsO family protein